MLQIKNITKIYTGANSVTALDDISVTFKKNEFVSILGPSGCGKTTLLNIIGGLDRYTSGDLVIDGISTKDYFERDWDAYRNNSIGFVFQTYNLIPHQNVLQNVELSLTLAGMDKQERLQKAKLALEKVGLANQLKKYPNQLSGGQMQRVAIARAIVNDPEIILADEPTGALDSVTSQQVLDLLKEIAKDKLVIMVTHNTYLAQAYSTRIINLLDGKIVSDSSPLAQDDAVITNGERPKKTKMSIATSFKLSMRNLITKRTRTFLTSFAGSIGIIGIALVLAVSNGFSIFIDSLQQNTMSNAPVTIYSSILKSQALDFENIHNIMGGNSQEKPKPPQDAYPDIDQSGITAGGDVSWEDVGDVASDLQHTNNFTPEFIEYLKENTKNFIKVATYNSGLQLNMFMRKGFDQNGELQKISVPYYSIAEMMATMDLSKYMRYVDSFNAMYSSINWTSLIKETSFITDNYDTLDGEFPTKENQIGLVVDEYNKVDKTVLEAMGFSQEQIKLGFKTSDFVGKTITVLPNSLFYKYSFETLQKEDKNLNIITLTQNKNIEEMYQDKQAITLTISGVVRAKFNSPSPHFNTGIIYTPMLTDKMLETTNSQQLIKDYEKADAICIKTSSTTSNITAVKDPKTKGEFYPHFLPSSVNENWQTTSKILGLSDMPSKIYIYAKDFESKAKVLNTIDEFNKDKEEKDQILIYDPTGLLTNYMGILIDGISYVLIAFAAISLVVSSIMIGIITYVSVVERTREIGVLRSLGASKKDIMVVFISETFIIGLVAGVLGIGISYFLSLIINLIMSSVAPLLSSLAMLNPLHALMLVGISFVLTVFAGVIPARIASNKDPVTALRTE
ncbi:MAG: ATP-binding cassette domain-containing protein [Clostridia bacterium]